MPTTHLLYLHGFRSSPRSAKAQQMHARIAADYPDVVWWAPQLPPSPREAAALIKSGTADWPRESMAVVGSSLGGFYALWMQHHTDCRKAVLLNPAVDPARDLGRHIGMQAAWHDPDERFFFSPAFIDELRTLASPPPTDPARVLAVIARGDEVLDWREMAEHCAGATMLLLDGSDHGLSDFARHIDTVLAFLDLA
jgi:predicted esterase YcpF (UPF0227 family)